MAAVATASTATQSTTLVKSAGSSEQKHMEGNSTTVPSSTGVVRNEEDPPLWGKAECVWRWGGCEIKW